MEIAVKTKTFTGWIRFMKNNKRRSENKKELSDRSCIRCGDPLPKKWSHAMCADCMEEVNE